MDAWTQIAQNMMQAPGAMPASADPEAQKRKLEQEKLDKQREADQMLSEHMNSIGAKPVIAGAVKDTQTVPDYSGETDGHEVTITRPADPERTVKHKSAGEPVQWELPHPQEQIKKQIPQSAFPQESAQPAGQPAQPAPQASAAAPAVPQQSQPSGQQSQPSGEFGGFKKGMKDFFMGTLPGSEGWYRQQEVNLQKQQADRAALEAHNAEIQHAMENGAKFVGPGGVVQETITGPDGQPTVIHRPIDPEGHIAKYKDPITGQTVQMEWPSALKQAEFQARLKIPANKAAAALRAEEAEGTAKGTALGKTAGELEDLKQRGVKLGPELAARLGMPEMADQLISPETRDKYLEKIVPVQAKTEAAKNLQTQKDAAALTRRQLGLESRESVSAQQIAFQKDKATRDEALKDWISQRSAAVANGGNLGKLQLPGWKASADLATRMDQQASSVKADLLNLQSLADPEETEDGVKYKDPATGLTQTMNAENRAKLAAMIPGKQKVYEIQRNAADRQLKQIGFDGSAAPAASVPAHTGGSAPRSTAPAGGGEVKHSATATMIANYQSPERTALARVPYGRREAIKQEVLQMNPEYHAEYFDNFNRTERDATTGKIGTSANALNTMMGHLAVLNTAAEALKNGDVTFINKIANKFGMATGATAPAVYNTIVHRLGPEVTKAYLAAGGSVGERGTNEADFDSSLGPDQIKQNIGVSALLADSKIKALQDQYQRGTYGKGKQKLMSDEAEAARQSLTRQAPAALRGGAAKALTGKQKSTGNPVYSLDGGKTWLPGKPPSQ